MLILTSNGLTSSSLLQRAQPHLTGARCALITTASAGYKEKDRNVPRLTQELLSCGVQSIECFDFDRQSAQELRHYDVAELIGGNPFYLLRAMRNTPGCVEILRELLLRGTIVGVSAGSMALTPSIGLAALYTPALNEGIELDDLTALSLFNTEVLPHYNKYLSRYERFEERAQAYERTTGCSVIRLNDGEALFLDA